jgi:sugar lactone lactonase YvrE
LLVGHIRTVAGNGITGWSGDGGPATAASLNLPHDVFVDDAGNLYIGDSGNQRVRRVDGQTGIITTVAGSGAVGSGGDGGLATVAQLNDPRFVTTDAAGNLFIAESVGHRVRRVDAATSIITTVAGGGPSAIGDGMAASAVALLVPSGMAFDAEGNLFVVETGWDRVLRIDAGADGVVTGATDETISVVAGTLGGGFAGDGGPAVAARFSNPEDIAFDPAGNLLVVDRVNNRVRRVTTGADGEITGEDDELVSTVAGGGAAAGDGAAAVNAALNLPRGIAVDRSGNVFISEANALRVRRVDALTGIITTAAGGGTATGEDIPATAARLTTSRGIATDRDGNLFMALLRGVIRAVRLAPIGVTDTVAPSTMAARNPAPVAGWNTTPVTVTLTATDDAGGCGVAEIRYAINGGTEIVVSGDSASIEVTGEGVTSISYFAVDAAGNVEPPAVLEIKIDMTPPAIGITQPEAGSVFLLNQTVHAEYACSDGTSGVATCAGPVASGAALDTGAPGQHTFTVSATDAAGNSATKTHTYVVGYVFDGFRPPLRNLPTMNSGRAGRNYAVKWFLRDALGASIIDAAAISSIGVVPTACGASTADVEASDDTFDLSTLKVDPATGEWHFNWKTSASQAGCWRLELRLADGSVHAVGFELR